MILVTGAAGYIGSFFIKNLLKSGHHEAIRAVDSFLIGGIDKVGSVTIEKADLADAKAVAELMKDVDTVVHCSAISAIPACENDSKQALLSNLLSLKNILEEGRKQNLKKIIFPSSFAVYERGHQHFTETSPLRPYNFYGFLKYWGEQLITAYHDQWGIDYAIFRQTNVTGVGLVNKSTVVHAMTKAAKNKQPITIFGSGQQRRNFIHIDDLAHVYTLALTNGVGTFNLAGPDTVSIKAIGETVRAEAKELLNLDIPIDYKQSDRSGRETAEKSFTCDTRLLADTFGYSPKQGINNMIREMLKT